MMAFFKSLVAAAAALSLFQGTSARVTRRNGTPAGPFCTDFTPFVYAGCFTDPGPRALPFSSNISSDAMTTEICVAFCKGNDYRYAGLEYYGECWCGASVAGTQVADSQCTFPCTGNNTEVCGGNSLLSVYQDPTFPPDNTSIISDYTPSGCWTEGNNGRTLVYRQDNLDTATLTVEKCLFSCKAGGYPLAGVEFAGECYCGVVLGNGTMQVDSSKCNMACNGNSSETCGGPALLNLYVATDLESSQPCQNLNPSPPPYSSSTASSTTSTSTSTTSSSTTSSSTTSSTSTSTTSSSTTSSSTTSSTSTSTTSSSTTSSSTTSSTSTSTTSSSTTSSTSTTSSSSSSTITSSSTTSTTSSSSTRTTKTTTSVSLCTTTISPSPTCEYRCGGSWCSNPLPTWSSSSDCQVASNNCLLQVAACFSNAQYPDSLKCWDFSTWCQSVSYYCSSTCLWGKCSKDDCISKYPPPPGSSSTPKISVYTCPTTTPTSPATTTKPSAKPSSTTCSTVPVPTSSGICQQPHNPSKGYSWNAPCGGIPLPCLTCNNVKCDYDAGSSFKLYNNKDTSKCSSYQKSSVIQGCKDACLSQYNSCIGTYAEGCKQNNWGNFANDDYYSASQKCQYQYNDCLNTNSGINAGSRCGSWNAGW